MPVVAHSIGKPDFSSYMGLKEDVPLRYKVKKKARKIAKDTSIFAYGSFVTVVNFPLLALVIFLDGKGVNYIEEEWSSCTWSGTVLRPTNCWWRSGDSLEKIKSVIKYSIYYILKKSPVCKAGFIFLVQIHFYCEQ